MTLLIRADASPQIGSGHVMRCLALAQAWLQTDGQVTFLMCPTATILETRLKAEGIQVAHLSVPPGSGEDAEQTIAQAQALGASWVVVDGYQFDADYQRVIKASGLRLLFIDDYGHANHYWADLVLNQNVYAHEGLYTNREPYTQLLLGTRYALLRKEFWSWQGWKRQIPPVARKVLVTLGGGDPDNVTLKVILALQQVEVEELEVVVVVGGSNPHYEELLAIVQNSGVSITLQRNVTNMPELMAWADVAISGGGSTCWELAFMGLPSLILILADNQQEVADKLDALGVVINLGWHSGFESKRLTEVMERLLRLDNLRQKMSCTAQTLVDGEGSDRAIMFLQDKKLRLRAARDADCELLWNWVNDSGVRASAFSSAWIPWEEHLQWFTRKFKDPNCHIFIAFDYQDAPIGQVRFDLLENQQAEIDISIAREQRGLGYGKHLIKATIYRIFTSTSIQAIHAFVKSDNYSSIKTFEKVQFQNYGEAIVQGHLSRHFVLTRSINAKCI